MTGAAMQGIAGADVQHIYRDAAGTPVLIANRFEARGDKKKLFLPFDCKAGQRKAPTVRPIYNLDQIAAPANLNRAVIWVEGEACADALTDLGYLATTSFGGCKALGKADLAPLAGRNVVIWPDHDQPGRSYGDAVAEALFKNHRAKVALLRICPELIAANDPAPAPNRDTLPQGWDVADAIRDGWGCDQIAALIKGIAPDWQVDPVRGQALQSPTIHTLGNGPCEALGDTPLRKDHSANAATVEGLELWKTPQNETYVTIRRNGHAEHWATGSKTFRDYLAYQHYVTEGKAPSNTMLDDRRRMLEGVAKFEGETHPVFSRIAAIGRTVYLDLCNSDWQAVAITAEGWQVVNHPPARFRRSQAAQPLPMPERHPDGINLLRDFLNVDTEDDFRMLVAWLLGCFHPKGPYPILILSGEQGSAKSTTAQTLRDLVDPASPSTRSTPRSEQDLVIAAMHNHVLSFDNLSTIQPAMADAFCRIATGRGFGTRKLHTDSDEVLLNATRPCLLNGIPDLASRPDLADRAIGVHLPVIPGNRRKTLGAFNRDFAKARPFILGALLDAVSCALQRIDSVSLSEAPRMADFSKWVVAAEASLGWPQGALLDSYAANRAKADQAAVESNPVALAILSLLDERAQWSGTASELRQTLRDRFPSITEDSQSFPRNDARFGGALRRVQPVLRRQGVSIAFSREGKSGMRLIEISR